MKSIIAIIILAFIISSCEKCDKNKKTCPTVQAEALPASISESFNQKYSSASSVTWFDKDGVSYCAVFTNNNKETKVVYDKSGNFVSEKVDNNKKEINGNDDEDDDSGCECEVDDDNSQK